MDQGAVAVYSTFLALQTGALVYYAGTLRTMTGELFRRVGKLETRCNTTALSLAAHIGDKHK